MTSASTDSRSENFEWLFPAVTLPFGGINRGKISSSKAALESGT